MRRCSPALPYYGNLAHCNLHDLLAAIFCRIIDIVLFFCIVNKPAAERVQYYFKGMTMKGIKKYLFMLMALAAVFGFVACSGDDDDDGPSRVAEYVAQEEPDEGENYVKKSTFYFYSDGSFKRYGYWWDEEDGAETWPEDKGTYTGKPAEDGEITVTVTHWADDDGKWVPVPEEMKDSLSEQKIEISGGTFTYDSWKYVKK